MEQVLISLPKLFAAEESAGGIAALGVDFKALILQIITFVLVFWLLKKFAFSKIVAKLDERRETIDQGVELGRQMAEEKSKLDMRVEELLAKARKDADKIISSGHAEAANLIKEAEQSASKKADALLADAKAKLDDDIAKAKKELEKQMLGLVADATEAVIEQKLDSSADQKLIEKVLREAA